MKTKDFIEKIKNFCPEDVQEEWDNSGWQIVSTRDQVNKVLLTLELTRETVEEAISKDVDLVITHHPLLFQGLKVIDSADIVCKLVYKLIKNDIGVYSCHTNFDIIPGGNNDYLGKILGIPKLKPIDVEKSGFLRVGEYDEPVTLMDIINTCSKVLEVDKKMFRLVGNFDKKISKVALCTGAGSDFIDEAFSAGCDLFITGDVKYHSAREADELGIAVLDIGHYDSEKIFADAFLELLKREKIDDKITPFKFTPQNPFKGLK